MAEYNLLDIARANYALVESLYEKYRKDPTSISPEWIQVLKELELIPLEIISEKRALLSQSSQEFKVYRLIEAYRKYGHLAAEVNPIAREKIEEPAELKLESFGFSQTDLSQNFPTFQLLEKKEAPLLEIIQFLKQTYASRIGYELKELQNPEFEDWLQKKIENSVQLPIEQKQKILEQLNKSELFDSFLHTKFAGQKRFSLEGGETLIPMLSAIIDKGASMGADEFILGMTHRGRLNALVNLLNKSYTDVFSEFDEGYFPDSFEGSGDVKYHKGFLSDVMTIHGHPVKISLTPNPSHLESVDAVVEGQVKARQIKRKDDSQTKIIPLLVHGDAALSGQGVVYETLQLYKLKGYSTGGTLHLVVNNQIGFTTLPQDARSTKYCTDIAKTFGSPVFHVNAEDPESCVRVALLAMEIRQKFHIDVFIDLNCYRKYGHNETDEPAFTQPLEYQLIRSKKPIREIYRDHLIQQGVVEKFMAESLEVEFKKSLHEAQRAMKPAEKKETNKPNQKVDLFKKVETGVSQKILREVAESFCRVPKDFHIHSKLDHLLRDRLAMVIKEPDKKAIDWGMAEILAYGTLLWNGTPVRLTGQDTGRGTFSHRHAIWMDQVKEKAYYPLSHLKEGQGRADVINSPLSEYAALGFEYGYSVAYPESLVLWEAQFGDFGNGAQVIIDQYISCAEQKWGQKSHLTLLLPHGYEGQGPEHSSARLERFLSLAGNDNMFICNPTTPAQFFHLIRRQMLGQFLKPLICLTPKLLLRHPDCVSNLPEFEKGHFEEVLDDPLASENCERILFCSGKMFYELLHLREKEKLKSIAIIRIEQLYPFKHEAIVEQLKKYPKAKQFSWVQEEPYNMGAWNYIHPLIETLLPKNSELDYIGRPASAAPATGTYVLHKQELAAILQAITSNKKGSVIEIAHFHRA